MIELTILTPQSTQPELLGGRHAIDATRSIQRSLPFAKCIRMCLTLRHADTPTSKGEVSTEPGQLYAQWIGGLNIALFLLVAVEPPPRFFAALPLAIPEASAALREFRRRA
ncbi:MAG: hypothetical protein ABI748_08465 [Dokdonella sp.]